MIKQAHQPLLLREHPSGDGKFSRRMERVDTCCGVRDLSIGALDDLLDLICVELQLAQTQFLDAEGKYQAIGRWLGSGTSTARWSTGSSEYTRRDQWPSAQP